MEQKNLDFFRDLLTRWLGDLLSRADHTVSGLRDEDEHLADPLDRAVSDINRNYTLRMRDRESYLIRKIKNSIEDIENGVYGICEDCGSDISIKRLKARPVAKRCFSCKTRQEQMEKLTGT
jgi:DnaK suppressor protein